MAEAERLTAGGGDARVGVRRPTSGDADPMGQVHVRAWQVAYRSVMPDEYFDGPRADHRAEMWRRQIAQSNGDGLLVATVDGDVVGFAAFGPCQDDGAAESQGQLYAINLDPDHWGKGVGRTLLRAATSALEEERFERLFLWVVPSNARARALYGSEGWTTDGLTRDDEILGVAVTELRYSRAGVGNRA